MPKRVGWKLVGKIMRRVLLHCRVANVWKVLVAIRQILTRCESVDHNTIRWIAVKLIWKTGIVEAVVRWCVQALLVSFAHDVVLLGDEV